MKYILLLIALMTFIGMKAQSSLQMQAVKLVVATIDTKTHKILSHSFHIGRNVIRVDASYIYDRSNPDFSVYYSQLLDSVLVYFDKKPTVCSRKEYTPDMHHYLVAYDSVITKQDGNKKSYLILGKPFFCNGHYCSSTSVLVVNVSPAKIESFEVDTEYWNSDELISDMRAHYRLKREWAIPVKTNNESKYPFKWVEF